MKPLLGKPASFGPNDDDFSPWGKIASNEANDTMVMLGGAEPLRKRIAR
jgi:hypothetical protein